MTWHVCVLSKLLILGVMHGGYAHYASLISRTGLRALVKSLSIVDVVLVESVKKSEMHWALTIAL